MSYINCPDCGFMYECINFQPCPICIAIEKAEDEDEEPEYFFDGEETFKLKRVG